MESARTWSFPWSDPGSRSFLVSSSLLRLLIARLRQEFSVEAAVNFRCRRAGAVPVRGGFRFLSADECCIAARFVCGCTFLRRRPSCCCINAGAREIHHCLRLVMDVALSSLFFVVNCLLRCRCPLFAALNFRRMRVLAFVVEDIQREEMEVWWARLEVGEDPSLSQFSSIACPYGAPISKKEGYTGPVLCVLSPIRLVAGECLDECPPLFSSYYFGLRYGDSCLRT